MVKARLFWHISLTEKTPLIVAEQLRFVERQPFPITAIIACSKNFQQLVYPVLNQLESNKAVDIIKIDSALEFEFNIFKFLYGDVDNYEFVGYFHTHGAEMESPHSHLWRNLMNFYIIQQAESAIVFLKKEEADIIGVFSTNRLEEQNPYAAGNFWWAKSSYIMQLPVPELLSPLTRFDWKLWMGLGPGRVATYLETDILWAPITGIGAKYDTDKKDHGYLPFYDLYLAPFRYSSGKLLEIGVYQGESLKLWQEALPHFVVEGVDLGAKPKVPAKVHVGDQGDRGFLYNLPDYDIVIDDGGHRSKQQIISLVSKIGPTALYVIEDLHTSLPDLYPIFHETGEITCLDYLNQYPNLKPAYISEAEHKKLAGKKIFIEQGVFSPIAFILKAI